MPDAPLKLFTWDGPAIRRIRDANNLLEIQPHSQSAALLFLFDAATRDAEWAGRGYPSVRDKNFTVPGADKSYYVSVVPYAFPCDAAPEGCRDYEGNAYRGECSPEGLPWIICDGHMNAVARDNSDRPRLQNMMMAVTKLALAGYVFRRMDFTAVASRMLRTWFLDPNTAMKPSLKFGQGIPGVKPGSPSSCMDLYYVGRGFADAVLLLAQTPDTYALWTKQDQEGMANWAADMAEYMTTSQDVIRESKMKNNHGGYYDLTVLGLAAIGGERSARIARRVLGAPACRDPNWCVPGRLRSQIDEGGMLIHEVGRADAGHYVWYTLYANAHLAAAANLLGNESSLELSADWAAPHATNPADAKIAGGFYYAVPAYRLFSRGMNSTKYERVACDVAKMMKKVFLKQMNSLGSGVVEIVYPPIPEAPACEVWNDLPGLHDSTNFMNQYFPKEVIKEVVKEVPVQASLLTDYPSNLNLYNIAAPILLIFMVLKRRANRLRNNQED